ncbi:MAG: hypothetical protein ACP5KW_04460 [Thermoproteota archaeon]
MEKKALLITFSIILLSAVVTGSMLLIVFSNPSNQISYFNFARSKGPLAIKHSNFVLNNRSVSSDFKNKILKVVEEDNDVRALFPNGFNVTFVQFFTSISVDANGKVLGQVTKVRLFLNSRGVRAIVIVDTLQWKVEKIIEIAVKVVNK